MERASPLRQAYPTTAALVPRLLLTHCRRTELSAVGVRDGLIAIADLRRMKLIDSVGRYSAGKHPQ